MFGPFSIDTIFPAFQVMEHDLNVDKVAMQQLISVYLIAYAMMSLLHGPLSDALGRKPVILGGLILFILASIGCALSRDLNTLLLFRALQGMSAGVGLIVGRAIIRDLFQGSAAQKLMSQVSMIFSIAPAIAPIIGGWILGWMHWSAIFWFLVLFSIVLLLITWKGLPETLPQPERMPLKLSVLVCSYVNIAINPRFQRLAAASAFNFGALFLYIASAPAFVMELLHLNERQFGWFFIPMISGMMIGAFVSGRSADRIDGMRLANIGFMCCMIAITGNIAYNLWVTEISIPWAVIPMFINAFGVALVFPIVTLAILDMYPHQRGSASSLQAFTGLVLNAVIAGVVSPLLSGSALHLALGGGGFLVLAWIFWQWESHSIRRKLKTPQEPIALEPQDTV